MYTNELLQSVNGRARRMVLLAVALMLVGVGMAVVALVIRNRALGLAGLIAFCVLGYACYALLAAPWVKYARFVGNLLTGRSHAVAGTFDSLGEHVHTTEDGIMVRDVGVLEGADAGEPAMYYWDDRFNFPAIERGRKLEAQAFGRYIRAVTVADEV